MKKFKFTLEKYLEIKVKEDEKLKKALSDVNAQIAGINLQIADVQRKEDESRQRHSEKCKTGVNGAELHQYSEYMTYLHDVYVELTVKLKKLHKRSDELKEKLIVLYNEIKALNRLKEEQLRAFLKEIQDEQDRQIDDFVSFQAYSSL